MLVANNSVKEQFFLTHLIPAGQLTEIMLAMRNSSVKDKDRTELSNILFDMLNLTACYVSHPGTSSLDAIAVAVEQLNKAMVKVFESLGTNKAPCIAEVFGISNRTNNTELRRKYAESIRNFTTNILPPIQQALNNAIGYQPANRQSWIAAVLSGASALTRGGRTNRWRTFVRNLSWEKTATMLGVRDVLARNGVLEVNCFNTSVGRSNVNDTWTAAFNEPTLPVSSEKRLTPMPAGIRVTSTLHHLLQVSAEFSPNSFLEPAQVAHIKSQPKNLVPENLTAALAASSFVRVTDVAGLMAVIAEASAWSKDQQLTRSKVQSAYTDWVDGQKLSELRTKLDKTFSKEERALLLKLLAEPKTA